VIYQEKIFTKEECKRIIDFKNIYTDLPFREREKNIDFENHRIDQLVKIEGEKKFGKFFNVWDIKNDVDSEWMFFKLTNWFSKISNVELTEHKIIGCSLHKYSKGDLFMKHRDISTLFMERRWNLGIQLNSDYIGGDYICYTNNNTFTFDKTEGTALAYAADIEHEITEIVEVERWSLVLSIRKENIKEKRKLF